MRKSTKSNSNFTSPTKSPSKKSQMVAISLREYREQQRIAEEAHMGPGATEYQKPFASELNNMTIFGKYKTKYPDTPGPGIYEPESATGLVKPRSQAAMIKEENGYRVPRENLPDPGQYDGHIKPFGKADFEACETKMTIGGKYKFVPDQNPAPGQYEPEGAVGLTKPRSKAAMIKEESGYRVPRENNPDPGQYDAHLRPMGSGMNNVDFGNKYKFVPDQNPAPGQYEPEGAAAAVKPRSYAAVIKEESGYKVPRENSPDPGQYDAHLRPMGSGMNNVDFGNKYKFKPDSNPAPGQYQPEGAVGMTKPRSYAAVIKEESGYKVPRENAPDPGQYDAHLRPMGSGMNNVDFGNKYKFVPDQNPAPGQYQPEGAVGMTKPRSYAAVIKEESGYRVPRENAPDPGQYDAHLRPMGSGMNNVDFGNKYKFVPDQNPAPGQYQPEGAVGMTKPRSYAAVIKEESGYKVPRENSPDPGQYDAHLRPMGSGMNKVDFGNKYKFVPDQNPAPGQYEPEGAVGAVKPRSYAAVIKEESGYKVPRENAPAPGQYDGHIKPFGKADFEACERNMTIGGKYKFVPDQNPAPGQYDPQGAVGMTKPRSYAAVIKEESGYRVPRENAPDPGQYDAHLKPMGSGMNNVNFGDKYKFVPDQNPAPGQYDPMSEVTKPRASTATIRQPVSPTRRPMEHTPSPGDYINPNLFGTDGKGFHMGEKRKYPQDKTPGPGHYEDVPTTITKPRAMGGKIHAEQMIMVDVNSLRGPNSISYKARAQSPGVRPSATLSAMSNTRGSPIKPFNSTLKGKKMNNSRLMQSIGKLKETTFNDLDQAQKIKAARRGTEIKKKPNTAAASQDYGMMTSPSQKAGIRSSQYSKTTASKTLAQTSQKKQTAQYFN